MMTVFPQVHFSFFHFFIFPGFFQVFCFFFYFFFTFFLFFQVFFFFFCPVMTCNARLGKLQAVLYVLLSNFLGTCISGK